jgi:hypothetical protein
MPLTREDVAAIRAAKPQKREWGTTIKLKDSLAKKYGVSRSAIHRIWKGTLLTGSQGPKPLRPGMKPFKKGQPSANPNGRPEWSKVLSKAYKKQLAKQYGSKDHTWADEIAAKVAKLAVKGNMKAATELADRSEGRALILTAPGFQQLPHSNAPDLVFQFVSVQQIEEEKREANNSPALPRPVQTIDAPRTIEAVEREDQTLLEKNR